MLFHAASFSLPHSSPHALEGCEHSTCQSLLMYILSRGGPSAGVHIIFIFIICIHDTIIHGNVSVTFSTRYDFGASIHVRLLFILWASCSAIKPATRMSFSFKSSSTRCLLSDITSAKAMAPRGREINSLIIIQNYIIQAGGLASFVPLLHVIQISMHIICMHAIQALIVNRAV